jgi:molybdate transport system substrate-binding protein
MRRLAVVCALIGAALAAALLVGSPAQAKGGKTVTVLAASSLKEFMDEATPIFEKAHPGVTVRVSLAGSSECRTQVEQGVPADVFLSADTQNMDPLVATRAVDKPVVFAHNKLAIVVSKRAARSIRSYADLAKPGLKLVLAAAQVPVGRYARQMLQKVDQSGKVGRDFSKRVLANVVSDEPNVKSALAKVVLGEADASVVYVTDMTASVLTTTVQLQVPAEANPTATYPIAVIARAPSKALAREFVKFVLSPEGKQLLKKRGFLP